jgi:peptide/nickel transport system ATP-binding protein
MKLQLSGLKVRYRMGSESLAAVDGVDLAIPKGGTVGLVGESGCGKSTLARAVVGLVPISEGRVLLDGVDYTDHRRRNKREFRRRVQMIFQDPYSSLDPRMSVAETLGEAMITRGIRSPADRRRKTLEILDQVGLSTNSVHRYPHQFSGGQRQRVAIARALSVGPELIISDEVSSALDVSVQATILNLLKELQREFGLAYLFISHDLSTVRLMSDSVAVMYLGRIVETADVDALFEQPQHPYTQALIRSIPRLGARRPRVPLSGDLPDPRRPPNGCRFHTRCPMGPLFNADRTICVESDPHEAAADREHGAACHFAGSILTGRDSVRADISDSAPVDLPRV